MKYAPRNTWARWRAADRFEGRKPSWKKAFVTLKHGEKPVDYGEAI